MTEKPGIYQIKHIISGKVYVGSASNISKRWSRHHKDLRAGIHKNKHLQSAWIKYGEDSFVFEILEFTQDFDSREQYWIDTTECLDPEKGYNHCPIARSTRGVKLEPRSPEMLIRQSAWLKGKCGIGVVSPVLKGIDNPMAKFTENDIREIRTRYGDYTFQGRGRKHGQVTYDQIAQEYGVVPSVICDIIKRKTWVHVA